jgi:hypothetical protein
MSRGLGQSQKLILGLLLEAGGALATPGILTSLFDKADTGPGTKEYNAIHSILSRSLKGLRKRGLLMTYTGVNVGGHAAVIAALTAAGVEVAGGIEWPEES